MRYWLIAVMLCSAGCQSLLVNTKDGYQVLGIRRSSWDKMSTNDRQSLMLQYRQNTKLWRDLNAKKSVYTTPLRIILESGDALFGEEVHRKPFRPVSWVITPDSFVTKLLCDTSKSQCIPFKSYYGKTYLHLDPSPRHRRFAQGSIKIPLNILQKGPIRWCELKSWGLSSLDNTCMRIIPQKRSPHSLVEQTWYQATARKVEG